MALTTKATRGAKPRKERVKGDVITPDYMLRLMEHVGPTAAAKAIGTTPGTLHKARNAHAVSRPLEVAAKGIWLESYADVVTAPPAPRTADLGAAVHGPTSEGTVLMLVQVPTARAAMLLKTAEMLGATVVVQD